MTPVLTHIALHVRDLDACMAFYSEFCGLSVTHERAEGQSRTVWMAEPGREKEFVFVLLAGGPGHERNGQDFGHFGFALETQAAVDEVARRARTAGCLIWQPTQAPFPVGYFCGVRDPDGNCVEFSYGQPLGPGAAQCSDTGEFE